MEEMKEIEEIEGTFTSHALPWLPADRHHLVSSITLEIRFQAKSLL